MATPTRSEAVESAREQEEKERLEKHLPLHESIPFSGIATVVTPSFESLALAMFLQLYTTRWEAGQALSRLEDLEVW